MMILVLFLSDGGDLLVTWKLQHVPVGSAIRFLCFTDPAAAYDWHVMVKSYGPFAVFHCVDLTDLVSEVCLIKDNSYLFIRCYM